MNTSWRKNNVEKSANSFSYLFRSYYRVDIYVRELAKVFQSCGGENGVLWRGGVQ